mgnify:CR=1 FL=1
MFQRKRLLIGVSGSLFVLPFLIDEIRNLISIGLLYFLGMYFILFNFPVIGIFVSSKPHYIEDLDNDKYRKYCIALQNLFMSILFGIMTDIFYMEKLHTRSIIEIFGILGGNIALFSNIQNVIGKALLITLSYCNKRERKSSEEEQEND